MSDDRNIDEREALAAEYALGVLGGADRAAAESLLSSDSDFAAAVARWKSQLSPLVETVAPMTPSSGLWDRIDTEIAPPVRRAPVAAAAKSSPGFWSNLSIWRGMSFASTAAAAMLAVVVLSPREQAPVVTATAPLQTARADLPAPVLMSNGSSALVAAAYDPNLREVLVTPATNVDVPAGRTMELWIIIGDKPPRSLGVIEPGAAKAHVLPNDVRADLAAGATLAISIEPIGGSRTGAPTGPVVATGKLTAV